MIYMKYMVFNISGHLLSMIPVEPKLGKMLIFGAIFSCLDPILTVVSGLSVRDPFLMPFDKKDVRFSPLFINRDVCFVEINDLLGSYDR